ncbi:TonB-dependent receptor [Dyadobacter frigoris]|uniref:TonB-dependent receptor n=2 Tax=Dyadobacter frigoris TaxID=2576211 RepID=A0A4U6CVQ8_9BACT|nr:TonB-dependent receptor [Dyadobacter frigoris]
MLHAWHCCQTFVSFNKYKKMKKIPGIIDPLWTIMKFSSLQFFLAVLVSVSSFAHESKAQELLLKKVTIQADRKPIKEVLAILESKANVSFVYSLQFLPVSRRISINIENKTLAETLEKMFLPDNISYKIINKKIVLQLMPVSTSLTTDQQGGTASISIEQADEKLVTGQVVDETKNVLPGVNIAVKGTATGTTTDVNGQFSLKVPDGNAVLVFSFVGYVAQEINVGNKSSVDVTLAIDNKNLEEVVVVGYGTQKKVNLTGAVGSVQMSDMKSRPLTNTGQALQGTIAGVYALQSSGQPGADGAVISIRGVGTFGDNSPLVLIDGFPGSMTDVNPNDIKSISVLKDAASSSIYGNRAANGVILITTNRGASGKLSISYNAFFGSQKATALPGVLNSVDYATLKNEAAANTGNNLPYTDSDIQKFAAHNDPLYPDINYFDVYYGKANIQNHRLNLSGGNEKVQFAFMLGQLNQKGILVGTNYKKTDFRANIDAHFLKNNKLRFASSFSGNLGVKNEPTDLWSAEWYASLAPVHPLQDANGHWMAVNGERNFYGEIKEGSTAKTNRYNLNAQLDAEYTIVDGLSAQVTYGYKVITSKRNAFHANVALYNRDASFQNLTSDLTVTNETDVQTMFTSLLKYNKTFGKHALNLLAGYSEEEFLYDWESGFRSKFVNNTQRILSLGDASTQTNNAGSYDLGLRSYFGRLNYVFNGKYLLEANIRRDGSSRFGQGHKWGVFPSFSAGWVITEERFMQSANWLSQLKIRASWGRLGNQNINNYYNGSDILSSGLNYSLGGTLYSGVAVTTMTNKDITWETAEQKNIGVDLTLKNGFGLTVDYFDKRTKDLLKTMPIPLTLALGNPYVNAGEVQNKGIEAALSYKKTFSNGLKFSSTVVMTHIVNRITKLDVPEELTSPKAIKVGSAINSFYGYQMDGIYQLSDFDQVDGKYTLKPGVVSVANFTAQPGDTKYKDLNGDGVVDMNNDRKVIGKQFPDLGYSLKLNFEWKGFDLGIFLQGVQGIQGYTYYEIATPFSGFANVGNWWKDRWTPENPSNKYPRLTLDGVRSNIHSSFYMENAAYLRLKNVEVGYSLNPKLLSRAGLGSVRVYGNIQNAFTLTKFKGFDPEQTTDQTRAQAFPQVRVLTMGISVNF